MVELAAQRLDMAVLGDVFKAEEARIRLREPTLTSELEKLVIAFRHTNPSTQWMYAKTQDIERAYNVYYEQHLSHEQHKNIATFLHDIAVGLAPDTGNKLMSVANWHLTQAGEDLAIREEINTNFPEN